MADTFKTITSNDVTSVKTLLHESVPITGTLVSGTYTGSVKNYTHGMFQSVYDYPYLSSSANHIFDLTVGYSSNSTLSSSANVGNKDKINIYNQMAQVLMGYDATGSIQEFDEDGDLTTGGTKIREAFFINFSRSLYKDEIKKGTFSFTVVTGGASYASIDGQTVISDAGAATSYFVNSPSSEYGILSGTNGIGTCGLLFYQAGIAVLTASMFNSTTFYSSSADFSTYTVNAALTGTAISASCDALRHRWSTLSYVNTTELNSTIAFCRINHNEFNYSSNPTYLSGSKIRVKDNPSDPPVAYITSVGLYSADNELLAVGKLSEPIKKSSSDSLSLKCRVDW